MNVIWAVCCALMLLMTNSATANSETTTQPNILLLVAEDLSPRIGAFGDQVAQTPNIDQLAQQGMRLTRVFTTAGVCAPSRAALITGQYQYAFGGQHMRTSTGPLGLYYAQPAAQVRAFPELMRQHGYYTFTDSKLDYQFSGIRAGSGPFTIWDAEAVSGAPWRAREAGQPFFGMINFLQTHESGVMRATGPAHSEAHRQTQIMRRKNGLIAPSVTDPAEVVLPPYYPDLPEVRADVARHYDNIARMDDQVGSLLAALDEDGLRENTVIIWTTDHGDGLPRAKRELFDSGLHVPMVMLLPPALQAANSDYAYQAGGKDSRLVSFIDLAPTLLHLAGIQAPSFQHGQSIFAPPRNQIFAGRDRIDEVQDRQRAVRSANFKYIRSWHPDVAGGHPLSYRDNLDMVRAWRSQYQAENLAPVQSAWFEPLQEERLFDLRSDPHELNDLAGSQPHQAVLNQMREHLTNHLQRVGDTSSQPESQMRSALLDDDKVPTTPQPSWRLSDGLIVLESPVAASVGYRLPEESRWRLYTSPLQPTDMEIKSVRYGWFESPEVAVRMPIAP